jgi:hypothetical protein
MLDCDGHRHTESVIDRYVGSSPSDCKPFLPALHFAGMRILQILALFTCLCSPIPITAQKTLHCDEARVTYEAQQPSESQFRMEKVARTVKPPGTLNKSPQGTRWLSQSDPDFTQDGPWTTTILIGDHSGSVLKLTFPQHGNEGIHSDWLNEKLLFMRVWLGRIVSLDLILDVEKGALVYSEEANYDDFIQPCE